MSDEVLIHGVVRDLASFPDPSFGVVFDGVLLPVRFATSREAAVHLAEIGAVRCWEPQVQTEERKEAKDGPKAV